MKFKKFAAAALSAFMVLSMTACGSEAAKDDLSMVKERGNVKIGFTYYEPMNYNDDEGNFTGFETEFAKAVCEKIGVEPEFTEINWDGKVMSLDSHDIDLIWNGMTITPELEEAISVSEPYLSNYQVIVIRKDKMDEYKTTADLKDKNIEAEAGSAGEKAVAAEENLKQANYLSVLVQTDALLEVKTGAADAAVMDFVLADTVVGKGDFSDLYVIPDLRLSEENYAVGMRRDSTLLPEINKAIEEMLSDGSLRVLAEKYELDDLLAK